MTLPGMVIILREIYTTISQLKKLAQCPMRPQTEQPHVLVLSPQFGRQVVLLMRILLNPIRGNKLVPLRLCVQTNMQGNPVISVFIRAKRKIRGWIPVSLRM